jgi:ComF family protein
MISEWLRALRATLDALFFPWSCSLCGTEASNGPFCNSCRQELLKHAATVTCPRCGLRVVPFGDVRGGCSECRGRSLGFDAVLALGPYEGAIRTLCLQLKHEPNAWIAAWLSDLLFEARHDGFGRLPADSWIVPVPLHWWRYWIRGYNQAEALALGLARRLHFPVHSLLRRVVATPHLAPMGPTSRQEVMRGVFRARRCPLLAGRTVLLVDDVLTSGATCSGAARALRKAGAGQVIAVVIARAEKHTT